MKTSRALLTITASYVFVVIGCHHESKPVFHVTAANPDQDIDLTATYQGVEYKLSVDRSQQSMYVAYYEPIDIHDLGKDFDAVLDKRAGQFTVKIPGRDPVIYNVRAAREVPR